MKNGTSMILASLGLLCMILISIFPALIDRFALYTIRSSPVTAPIKPSDPPRAKEVPDDDNTFAAVKMAIEKCGISKDDPSEFSVWTHHDTWTTVETRRKRLESIKAWSLKLTDSTLKGIYLSQISQRMTAVEEAENELRDHGLEKRMDEYEKHEHRIVPTVIQEPPCDAIAPTNEQVSHALKESK